MCSRDITSLSSPSRDPRRHQCSRPRPQQPPQLPRLLLRRTCPPAPSSRTDHLRSTTSTGPQSSPLSPSPPSRTKPWLLAPSPVARLMTALLARRPLHAPSLFLIRARLSPPWSSASTTISADSDTTLSPEPATPPPRKREFFADSPPTASTAI